MFIVPITPMNFTGISDSSAAAGQGAASGVPFADVFKQAINNMQETRAVSEQDGYGLAMGETDNLAAMMLNSAKAEVALNATLQITSRAVGAYKEIMQMQV